MPIVARLLIAALIAALPLRLASAQDGGGIVSLPATLGAMVQLTKAYGPGFPELEKAVAKENGDMDESVKQSIACAAVGAAATGLSMLYGSENLVNLIAGGLVPATSPVTLYLSVTGVVFASFCSIGQALTPMVLYYTGL